MMNKPLGDYVFLAALCIYTTWVPGEIFGDTKIWIVLILYFTINDSIRIRKWTRLAGKFLSNMIILLSVSLSSLCPFVPKCILTIHLICRVLEHLKDIGDRSDDVQSDCVKLQNSRQKSTERDPKKTHNGITESVAKHEDPSLEKAVRNAKKCETNAVTNSEEDFRVAKPEKKEEESLAYFGDRTLENSNANVEAKSRQNLEKHIGKSKAFKNHGSFRVAVPVMIETYAGLCEWFGWVLRGYIEPHWEILGNIIKYSSKKN